MQFPWQNSPQPLNIGHWPTPLEPLPRLSAELGGPNIWVKRDDCTGLATGGNKTRKLAYLLSDAQNQEADVVITYGAVQSNHARQTAAACAKLGIACHLLLAQRVPYTSDNYESGGNVLLDRLCGAQVHIHAVDDISAARKELLTQLEQENKRVYEIPAGGSNPIGALGYSQCATELSQQCNTLGIAPGTVMHASASSGTQAGLVYGYRWQPNPPQVLGINVFHPDPTTLEERVQHLTQTMHQEFGEPNNNVEIEVNHAYFGEGYGLPTQETLSAISMLAELEGLLFDPVYSGKAVAALIDQINLGNLDHTDDVILIHTGGSVALNVYSDLF